MNDLALNDLRDTIQTVINATTAIWYGTSDTLTPGKALMSEHSTPPFVIVHPDDVDKLPPGARHLRAYRPTRADVIKMAEQWREEILNQPLAFRDEPAERFVTRRWWGIL